MHQKALVFYTSAVVALAGTLFLSSQGFSQSALEFKPAANPVMNTFAFETDAKKLNQIHSAKGKKLTIPAEHVSVNAKQIPVDHIRIRGSTSSHYYRKSYNIELIKKASFTTQDTSTLKMKKIYAICLNMDRNYVRNKMAYAVLGDNGLNIPPTAYVNMVANSQSEGIYLFFYPPAEYALKECNSPFVIRRGYESSIKKTYDKKLPPEEAKSLSAQFTSVYKKILPKYQGIELYQQLNAVIDMENYFTWMAFNHLFQNGDYTDEVYFMWNKEKQKYELIPWDFDDLFQMKPHAESPMVKDKLIFSIEDLLDETIANDPYLYMRYLMVYRKLLQNFTSDKLKAVLENIYQQVLPYFEREDIIAQSRYDKYGQTDIANLQKDLSNIYLNVHVRMDFVTKELNKQLPH